MTLQHPRVENLEFGIETPVGETSDSRMKTVLAHAAGAASWGSIESIGQDCFLAVDSRMLSVDHK